MTTRIRVLLVDDHRLVRRGFRRLLEDEEDLEVVGEASNGVEAIQAVATWQPQVVVMDFAMPELDGVQATREILRQHPKTAVLILSMYPDEQYIRNALDAGAKGYLLKNAVEVDLGAAIRAVAAGHLHLGPGVKRPAAENEEDRYQRLTPREKQVLQLIAQGKSNKEIATMLNLSVNTVSVHRANLMEALDIHRMTELVLYAVRKGLVSPQ